MLDNSKYIKYFTFFIGKFPGKTLHRAGVVLIGIWLSTLGLSYLWEEPDQIIIGKSPTASILNRISLPKNTVRVLLIGLTSKNFKETSSSNFSRNKNKVESIIFLEITPNRLNQIVQIPIELAIQLPGYDEVKPLSSTFNIGGLALTSDVLSNILEMPSVEYSKYIIFPMEILTNVVDELGGITLNLQESINLKQNLQGLSLNISAGKNIINGKDALKLSLYKKNNLDHSNQRKRMEIFMKGFYTTINDPKKIEKIPTLANKVLSKVETDLTSTEFLSLISALINNKKPPVFNIIPLKTQIKNQILREIDSKESNKVFNKD